MFLSDSIWYKFLNPERTTNIYRYTQTGPENLNHIYLPKHDFASSLFSLALLYFSMFLPRHVLSVIRGTTNSSMKSINNSLWPKILWIHYIKCLALLYPPFLDCYMGDSSPSKLPKWKICLETKLFQFAIS